MSLEPMTPFMLAMVRDEEGNIRWPVVVGGVITAGAVAIAGWLVSTTAQLAKVEARQEIVLQRLNTIEASTHPATSKRYTSDDAREDRERTQREVDRLIERLERVEQIERREHK